MTRLGAALQQPPKLARVVVCPNTCLVPWCRDDWTGVGISMFTHGYGGLIVYSLGWVGS